MHGHENSARGWPSLLDRTRVRGDPPTASPAGAPLASRKSRAGGRHVGGEGLRETTAPGTETGGVGSGASRVGLTRSPRVSGKVGAGQRETRRGGRVGSVVSTDRF